MGNCCSFQISCDQVISHIFRCLCGEGYIRTLKKNLRSLQREMEDLRAIQDEVQNKVAREETRHQQRLKAVQVWLTRVHTIDIQFEDVLSTRLIQLQKLCLCGLCSKNVYSSYSYGKRIFLLLEEVKKLKLEGKFEVVSEPAPRCEVEERPTQPTIGKEILLEKALKRLREDEVGIMGLHGMGGVGKTTLFKKIHNKFTEIAGTFDLVIWIVVSQGAKISKIQEDIAQKLHLCSDKWKNKNESDKATDIHTVLKGKRFVLMLDDIWEKVDLEVIGVPFPTKKNKSKVAFTTRSREVCGRMGDHEPIQVNCLEPEEAWELFKNKVGDNTLRRDLLIVELARKVAEKCRGLPLALSVIGETMASKTTVQEWEHAIVVFTRSAAEFSGMENEILPVLKYSYDSLVDEDIKRCFLYCALFPKAYEIDEKVLIEYWICEGFMGEYRVIKEAQNKGYEVIGTLIGVNLLMKADTKKVVMHDVVREMALWAASGFGKQKETFVVQTRVGLQEIPKVKDLKDVKRISLWGNEIKEITCSSKCSQLTTLFLQYNHLKSLSGDFVQSMQKLVVLNLAHNENFSELPEQISELASLQYLNLSYTSIKQLPVGFQELKKLSHLDLTSTEKLCSISGISKLSSLRILKLLNSNVHGDVGFLKELQLLKHLQVLTIKIYGESSYEQISGDQRLVSCITGLDICSLHQTPFNTSLLVTMENLCQLSFDHVMEIDTFDLHNRTSPCFTNLSHVFLYTCTYVRDLTWLLFAPNLERLEVMFSDLSDIIDKAVATNLTATSITPFQKLKTLSLDSLPWLESIFWSPLPFPSLTKLSAINCPRLGKLPLDAKSAPQLGELSVVMYQQRRETEFQWEDEDTKHHFLPLLRTELEW